MIKLLLDFPWEITASLGPDPRPRKAIHDFLTFLDRVPLRPATFVEQGEYVAFLNALENAKGRGGLANIFRFVNHVLHDAQGHFRATPLNGPDDLRPAWERALRDHLGDLRNWRSPQIVVCPGRESSWHRCIHNNEAIIVLEDRPHDGAEKRVVITIEPQEADRTRDYLKDYQHHKYAAADLDPWDVRHIYYPIDDGGHYNRCRLPRPEHLSAITLEQLDEELDRLRSQPWPDNDKYWYLPPAQWRDPGRLSKEAWRRGAFPEAPALNRKRQGKRGPVDYSGRRIWLWDREEGHWDVQLPDGTHRRINHRGECLG